MGSWLALACVDVHAAAVGAPKPMLREHDSQASNTSAQLPRLARIEAIGVYTGRVSSPGAEPGAFEIAAFDAQTRRLFVTTGVVGGVEVIDLSDPTAPSSITSIDLRPFGDSATSVDVADGVVAVAIPAVRAQAPGTVLLLRSDDLSTINHVRVGALPDMLTFSPDRRTLVVACEGEPADDLSVDPPGELAIIDVSGDLTALTETDVAYADFAALQPAALDARIHVHPRSRGVARDLEPEFVTISADSRTAWVSLQENSAMAIVDLQRATVTDVVALGAAPLSAYGELPVFGLRQPDAIAWARVDGRDVIVSANEGDCRSTTAMPEQAAARTLVLDPAAFPDAADLQSGALGQLVVSAVLGDPDHDGDHDQLYACGSRSVSTWSGDGRLLWDSGALLDELTAKRSDPDKHERDLGPRPEGVVTAELWGRTYAFVGLERAGGIVAFDLSDPREPSLVSYEQRDDDVGPEGIEFVAAEDSPNGEPLLIVANEISRTVRIYRLINDGQ